MSRFTPCAGVVPAGKVAGSRWGAVNLLRSAVLGLAIGLSPMLADAAGLGTMTVSSRHGAPLRATVEILGVTPEEAAQVEVRLASPRQFADAGFEYPSYLQDIRFNRDELATRQVVRLSTHQPVRELHLSLLVEISWSGGRLTRAYQALLDPGDYVPPPAVPHTGAVVRPEPRTPRLDPVSPPTVSSIPAAQETSSRYRVQQGDTLHGIARRHVPPNQAVRQFMLAIYRLNPGAFYGSIHQLRSGKVLLLPVGAQTPALNAEQQQPPRRASTPTPRPTDPAVEQPRLRIE